MSDHVLDASKLSSDTSDNSDTDEQTTANKKSTNTCVQRLFSPDSRSEQYLERISSPESTYSPRSVFPGIVPVSETVKDYRQADCETHYRQHISKESKDVTNECSKPNISTSDTKAASTVKDNNNAQIAQAPAKKIWSIANIIG